MPFGWHIFSIFPKTPHYMMHDANRKAGAPLDVDLQTLNVRKAICQPFLLEVMEDGTVYCTATYYIELPSYGYDGCDHHESIQDPLIFPLFIHSKPFHRYQDVDQIQNPMLPNRNEN